jgi:hypothetical protein
VKESIDMTDLTYEEREKIYDHKLNMETHEYARGLARISFLCFGFSTLGTAAGAYTDDNLVTPAIVLGSAALASCVCSIVSGRKYKIEKAKLSKYYESLNNKKSDQNNVKVRK